MPMPLAEQSRSLGLEGPGFTRTTYRGMPLAPDRTAFLGWLVSLLKVDVFQICFSTPKIGAS